MLKRISNWFKSWKWDLIRETTTTKTEVDDGGYGWVPVRYYSVPVIEKVYERRRDKKRKTIWKYI